MELVIRTNSDVVIMYIGETNTTTSYTVENTAMLFSGNPEICANYTSGVGIVTECAKDCQLKYFDPVKFCTEIVDGKLDSWIMKMRIECIINEEYFNFIANLVKSLRDSIDRTNIASDIDASVKKEYLANILTKKVLIESVDDIRCQIRRMHDLIVDELQLTDEETYRVYLSFD